MVSEPLDKHSLNHCTKFLRTWQAVRPVRPLFLLLVAELLVSSLFILVFCITFNVGKWLVAVHLPLAALFYGASVLVPGVPLLHRRIRSATALKYFLGLIPGFCFTALLFLYAFDFASYRWLGAQLNYEWGQILFNLITQEHVGPLSSGFLITLTVITVLLLGVFIALGAKVFRGVEVLLSPEHPLSLFHNRARTRQSLLAIAVLLCAYAAYLYFLRYRAPYNEVLSNDPIVSFFRNTTGLHDADYPAFVEKLRQNEQRCRENYRAPASFDRKNVIVISVDSLRADHLSLYGYSRPTSPFLESLFQTGKLRKVEVATSICAETPCGVMGILSSKTVRRQIPESFKLYEALANAGYTSYLILAGNHDLAGERESLGNSMTRYFDYHNSKTYDMHDDRLILEGLDHVPAYDNQPAFFFLHLMSAHLLGTRQDQFRRYSPSTIGTEWQILFKRGIDREAFVNNYDNGALQSDAMIKNIFEVLERKQYLQNSIVVILADHGEGLGERGEYGHAFWLYQGYIRIPMLIFDPTPTGYQNLEFANQIDVAPTILDRLRLPIPECWQGQSLLSGPPRLTSVHQTRLRAPCFAVISRTPQATYKYIYCSTGKTEELYDLTHDPNEQTNLMGNANVALIQSLRAECQSYSETPAKLLSP
jgi:glucan phosphoethanolaminetransferase (alkaline phosphatase superfamily)